jgi:chemotaxis protein MotB
VKNPSVIIVKKVKKGGHGGHHGGAWKVAYADFVTAMMAFFLVMWLVAQSNAVKAAVAGYFKDPGIFEYEKSNGVIPGGGQAPLTPDDPAPKHNSGGPSAAEARAVLENTASRLRTVLESMPDFKMLGKQIEMQVTSEGLRIELLERSDSTFFDSGSAQLREETVHILQAIARELGRLPNEVVIEGHTDSQPFASTDGYTNWELSADRANAARRVMERGGLHDRQVKGVRGYADTRLRLQDQPTDPRNRRVSIILATTAAGSGDAGPEERAGAPRPTAPDATPAGHAAPPPH